MKIRQCGSTDFDAPNAQAAYRAGCDAGDFHSCARLGQYYEIKSKNPKQASTYYEMACKGGEKSGCEGAYDIDMEMCYLKKDPSYCGKEPHGEFRVLAFLQTFNPKYENALVNHEFEEGWRYKETADLYKKLIENRSQKLLKALRYALKKRPADGADSEDIQSDIWKLQGGKRGWED